jgi:hypothetical protein
MLSLTVEAADDLLANSCLFRWISGFDHAFRQTGQLVSGQLSLGVQLISKPNYAQLLLRIESFNFFDDLCRSHAQIVSRLFDSSNEAITYHFLLETHSLPAVTRCCPRSFAFYLAYPTRSILTSSQPSRAETLREWTWLPEFCFGC